MLRTRSSARSQRPCYAAWWEGPTLAGAIDELPAVERGPPRPLRLPVADVIPGSRTLGAAAVGGKVEGGIIAKGQKVLVMPAGVEATVRAVEAAGGVSVAAAHPGDSVDVGLDGIDPASLGRATPLVPSLFDHSAPVYPYTLAASAQGPMVELRNIFTPRPCGWAPARCCATRGSL